MCEWMNIIMFQYNLIYKNGLWPESHSVPIPVLEEPKLPCASGKEQEPQKELADLWSPGIGPAYLTLHPKVMQAQGQLSRHQQGPDLVLQNSTQTCTHWLEVCSILRRGRGSGKKPGIVNPDKPNDLKEIKWKRQDAVWWQILMSPPIVPYPPLPLSPLPTLRGWSGTREEV